MGTTILSPGPTETVNPTPGSVFPLCREFRELDEQAFIQVAVSISPQNPAAPPLDARGRMLHCNFYLPNNPRSLYRLPNMVAGVAPIGAPSYGTTIEADQGSYFLPREVSLSFVGGNRGDAYSVDVILSRVLVLSATQFWLTSVTVGGGAIIVPLNHLYVRLISGTLTVNGVAIATTPFPIPANGTIIAGANTVYQTGVIF
jgi:hypothetical protein